MLSTLKDHSPVEGRISKLLVKRSAIRKRKRINHSVRWITGFVIHIRVVVEAIVCLSSHFTFIRSLLA